MRLDIRHNSIENYIETTVTGLVTMADLREIFGRQAELSALHDCDLLLNDYRRADLKMETIDIYGLPAIIEKIAASFGRDARQARRALVVDRAAPGYAFFETVTANNFQTEKLFFDIDAARLWLRAFRRPGRNKV